MKCFHILYEIYGKSMIMKRFIGFSDFGEFGFGTKTLFSVRVRVRTSGFLGYAHPYGAYANTRGFMTPYSNARYLSVCLDYSE